jgi:hypothetical protein
MEEQREYPRVQQSFKVCFEFVKWNEWDLDEIKKPITIRTDDISVSGLKLQGSAVISRRDLKRLAKGTRKIRLAFYLQEEEPPLMCFARLIWTNYSGRNKALAHEVIQFGLKFIDVSGPFLKTLSQYVDNRLSLS